MYSTVEVAEEAVAVVMAAEAATGAAEAAEPVLWASHKEQY